MKKFLLLTLPLLIFFFSYSSALAQNTGAGSFGREVDPRNLILCNGRAEVKTAVGCLPFNNTIVLSRMAAMIAIGVSGSVALIIIAINAFRVMTSSGDPKSLQAAKDNIFSGLGGLLMIIFCTFVLRLIGVDILQLF